MSRKYLLLAAAGLGAMAASSARAEAAAGAADGPPAAQASEIVVTAQRLDAARSAVEPALGATSYSMPEA
ncbi:MAG TPA: hypothetical protein VFE10_02675, partial [Phenylobacterium sp.]|nr:hypothetical protein [Phenylobacterium sp.]